ncbi:uncharacterized protein ACA1_171820 [Acanthamoeba castellanii str. Neff]|uniref:BAR domain-containing protein n=1 Tax=Acanthamoeba castellanii (strain ATCC 30010 / Neff) TaxID=1257118 RepID=L8HIV1_ACACF|nr:uncharacterized protein ACA1_171820 [Acanthamoeba castellanii str. Neff]ELR24598.1 hypothetical protein ACA1_171820 [Acanthamoeba castellanii str. Neff]
MKGFMTLRSNSSTRNLEKKKKRDGINLQSDSILDQSPVLSSSGSTPINNNDADNGTPSPGSLKKTPPSSSLASSPSSSSQSSPSSFLPRASSSPSLPSRKSISPPHSPSSSSSDHLSSRASTARSNRSTRLIGKLAIEEPNEAGHFQLDADTDVKNRDDQVRQLKSHLKKLAAAVRRLNTDALRYVKANNAFAQDAMDKLQIAEKRSNPDSVYAEALTKFAEAERNVAANVTQFHQVPSDQLIARILEFVEKDISTELKNTKSKYEKARRDYDGAVDKVTTLRGKSKPDVIKLYNAERDLKRLKKAYEDALEEVHIKLEDIELKKSCSLIEWLILYLQQERDMYGESFVIVQHLEGYLKRSEEEVRYSIAVQDTTQLRGGAYIHANTHFAFDEQAAALQVERDAIYDPLIQRRKTNRAMGLLVRQLVDSNPGVVAILQRIISSESKNVTVPSKGDTKGVANFQAFIKDNYNDICLELIAAGYREQMKELASAMGFLEKAREDIEL